MADVFSGFSNSVSATLTFPAPSELTGTLSATDVILEWLDNTTGETGFVIERKLSTATAWVTVATVGAGITTATITGQELLLTYDFRVRAQLTEQSSEPSNEVQLLIDPSSLPANSPQNVTVRSKGNTITFVTWESSFTSLLGFEIERQVGSEWVNVGTVGPTTFEFTESGLAANTLYNYRVRAYDNQTVSQYGYGSGYTFPNIAGSFWGAVEGDTRYSRILTLTGSSPYFKLNVATIGNDDTDRNTFEVQISVPNPETYIWGPAITPPAHSTGSAPAIAGTYWASVAPAVSWSRIVWLRGYSPFFEGSILALDFSEAKKRITVGSYNYGPALTIPDLP